MGQPAARVGDMHVCPMFDGPKPHVGGPVLPPGKPTVLIGGMPAATITDRCACASVPDIIMQGAQTVLINGMMAARLGDMTVHGGRIVIGCPTVLIGGPTFTDTSLLRFRPQEVEEPSNGEIGASMVLDVIPVIGTIKGLWEGVTGYDSVTGEKLSTAERLIGWIPVLGKAGRVVKGGSKLLKTTNNINAIKKVTQKSVIKNTGFVRNRIRRTANDVNNDFITENLAKGKPLNEIKPPWKAGDEVIEYSTSSEEKFVRVHTKDNTQGAWMMKEKDLYHPDGRKMTPMEIKDKFALPETPSHASEIKVPPDFRIRKGTANEISEWGRGGGEQYQAINRVSKDMIVTTKPLE